MKPFSFLIFAFLQFCLVTCIRLIASLTPSSSEKNYFITQSPDLELFQFSTAPAYSSLLYFIIEITISPFQMQNILDNSATMPITCYQYDSNPFVITDPSTHELTVPCSKGYDENQYKRANGFYSMIVPTPYGQYNNIMIGIYMQIPANYIFKIRGRFQTYPNDICPFDCNMGTSTPFNCQNQTCICLHDMIDYDCSQEAEEITPEKKQADLNPNEISYFYYRPEKAISNLREAQPVVISMKLKTNNPGVQILVSLEGVSPKVIVPTEDYNRMSRQMDNGNNVLKLDADLQYNDKLQPISCVLGFLITSPTGSNSITVFIQTSTDSMNASFLIIFFLVGVVGLLFIVWIVLTILKIKYARRNRVIDLTVTNQLNQGNQLNGLQNHRRMNPNASKLTQELIDQYMPAIPFSEIYQKEQAKGKTFIEACPVCLGEFEPKEICRQALCCHYFHKDCIEQWLKKQENCPFCRADLSRAALTGELQLSEGHHRDGSQQQPNNLLNTGHHNLQGSPQVPSSQNNLHQILQNQDNNLQQDSNNIIPPPQYQLSVLDSSPTRDHRNQVHSPDQRSHSNRNILHIVPVSSVSPMRLNDNDQSSPSLIPLMREPSRNINNNNNRQPSQFAVQHQQPSINHLNSPELIEQHPQEQRQQQLVLPVAIGAHPNQNLIINNNSNNALIPSVEDLTQRVTQLN